MFHNTSQDESFAKQAEQAVLNRHLSGPLTERAGKKVDLEEV